MYFADGDKCVNLRLEVNMSARQLLTVTCLAAWIAVWPGCADDDPAQGDDSEPESITVSDDDGDTIVETDSGDPGSGTGSSDPGSDAGDSGSLVDTQTDTESGSETETFTDYNPDPNYPADPGLITTLKRTVAPVLEPEPQLQKLRSDWGVTEQGSGEPHVLRDNLGVGDGDEQPLGEPTSVGYFWQLSDMHMIDEESPARLIYGDDIIEASYRNHESWNTQFLDATIRTGNRLHEIYPFDFALFTGDMVDNIHQNELDWFLETVEGGLVNPDSGVDDDPLPGSENDPHDPFEAEGLSESLPWYVVGGNHDDLILGNFDNLGFVVAKSTGDKSSLLSRAVVPTCLDEPWFDNESPVPERCYLPPKSYFASRDVIPDPARRFYTRDEWLTAFFEAGGEPAGHGLTQQNLDKGTAHYVVDEPIKGVPSVLVALDTVSSEFAYGTIDEQQLNWLAGVLDGAMARGQIAVVTSHHPVEGMFKGGQELVEVLRDHPNVIMHVAGHTHENKITPRLPRKGESAAHGYWEILTSSIVDWPQQTRILEIVDYRDGTGAIFSTMLDYEIPVEVPQVEGGRFYSLYDLHSGGHPTSPVGQKTDRNVKLRIAWPPEVAAALAELPTREVRTYRFDR